LILLLVVCLLVSSAVLAQTGTTSLRGAILDKSNAAIAGATVTLLNSQQGFERTTTSGVSEPRQRSELGRVRQIFLKRKNFA
jgi:hypothetical protein